LAAGLRGEVHFQGCEAPSYFEVWRWACLGQSFSRVLFSTRSLMRFETTPQLVLHLRTPIAQHFSEWCSADLGGEAAKQSTKDLIPVVVIYGKPIC
jgi:hypothetical protein